MPRACLVLALKSWVPGAWDGRSPSISDAWIVLSQGRKLGPTRKVKRLPWKCFQELECINTGRGPSWKSCKRLLCHLVLDESHSAFPQQPPCSRLQRKWPVHRCDGFSVAHVYTSSGYKCCIPQGNGAQPAYSGVTALIIASWVCLQSTCGMKLAGSLTWNKKLSGGACFGKSQE